MGETSVVLRSDEEYERLVCDMYIDNKYIGLLQQESDSWDFLIELRGENFEFPFDPEFEARIVRPEDLIEVIEKAKRFLLERRDPRSSPFYRM